MTRYVHYQHAGSTGWGLIESETLIPLAPGWPDPASALAAGPESVRAGVATGAGRIPLAEITFLPPLVPGARIFCTGTNYSAHAAEAGREQGGHPSIFIRLASSFVGHGTPVEIPAISDQLDFEAELVVVIGRTGRGIAREDALSFVAGYTCMAENSVRDFQRHSTQVSPGKNFDRSGSIGPWIVAANEIHDPSQLRIEGRLNGQVMQEAGLHELMFPIDALIAYVSSFTTLQPGDVIATGTPEGVGFRRTPPVFLRAGDMFEVDIAGVGCLSNLTVKPLG